jgi:glycosyltransferase involved in cell wall biosynthesis
MKIGLINTSPSHTGVGNYSFSLYDKIKNSYYIDHIYLNTKQLTLENVTDKSILAKINRIPVIDNNPFIYYRMQNKIPKFDLYHLTNQNLSFLKLKPKIVTCHDIIHELYPTTKAHLLLSKYLYKGLKDADFIITDSDSTSNDLITKYKIPSNKLKTVYLGIDHSIFRFQNDLRDMYSKYNLSEEDRYIFHISSEQPRKNLDSIIKAFYKVKKIKGFENLKLLKAGNAQYKKDRKQLISLINDLELQNDVIFINYVPIEDLPKLYSLSELFVFPSFYEGFGFPILESMACGTPVITSNKSSLPELAGDAAIQINPQDTESLKNAMLKVLSDDDLKNSMSKLGLQQSSKFTWEKCASETSKIYDLLSDKF